MERIPCEPNPDCKFRKKDGCYQNRHHLFYPKRNYTAPLEKKFRETFVEVMCRAEHEKIHHTQPVPEKPTIEEMRSIMEKIRDYNGRDQYRAEQIQDIVGFLGQVTTNRVLPQKTHIERTDLAQQGFDSLGDYHDPSLRLEKQ